MTPPTSRTPLAGAGAAEGAPATSQDRLQAVHDRLTAAVADLTDGPAWQQLLQTAARLPQYSPMNQILIAAQTAGAATAVCGYRRWAQLGRQVRKGEKAIWIMAPMTRRVADEATVREATPDDTSTDRVLTGFKAVPVFDIASTDGPDLAAPPAPVLLTGQAPPGLYEGLAAHVAEQGFELLRHPLAMPHLGEGRANGVTDFLAETVIVDSQLSDAQTAKTLSHELGHVLLHAPATRPEGLTRPRAEVEAESVAFVVTAAHGLDSHDYTVPYVTGWAGGDLTLVQQTAERVLSTARIILQRTPPPARYAVLGGTTVTRELAADRQQPPTVRREAALTDRPFSRLTSSARQAGRREATAKRDHTRDVSRLL
jgi:antirestriction protein ArdC